MRLRTHRASGVPCALGLEGRDFGARTGQAPAARTSGAPAPSRTGAMTRAVTTTAESSSPGITRRRRAWTPYDPVIHVLFRERAFKTWMAGSSPAMTERIRAGP